jgi:F0F1-type ATP synthase epsilon subunit
VRLADGAGISIYPGHAPLLAQTATASLCYADASGEQGFNARAGIVQVEDDQVTFFTSGESEPADRSALSATREERRFDRLARQLNAKLERWNLDVLESHREER